MRNAEIGCDDVKEAVKNLLNWKAPGIDGIHNFWLKKFYVLHSKMAEIFNNVLSNPENLPKSFTSGITYLLPKVQAEILQPSQYRPITCLPTLYKLFTSIITNKIYKHVTDNGIMPVEQKGCQRGSYGCKEQIIIDTLITEKAKKNKRSLYWGYIDYQKAFDSVPHSWLLGVLDLYKISPKIQATLRYLMTQWQTTLQLHSKQLGTININRGIFQGDSLSPLWFCLALAPLTTMLNKGNCGPEITANQKLTHLIYMDDIKIYGQTRDEIKQLLKRVQIFSDDIKMQFGLEKCKINGIEKGVWAKLDDYEIETRGRDGIEDNFRAIIQAMDTAETYKYLGVLQAKGIEHKTIKTALTDKYKSRLCQLLKTKLTAGHLTRAVNAYAVPVVGYSFGVINWTATELEQLNMVTRKMFTRFRSHHPHSSVERFHLPRALGGRGIMHMKHLHYKICKGIKSYFRGNVSKSCFVKAVVTADRNYTVLKLADECPIGNDVDTGNLMQRWCGKELHGRHICFLKQDHIDFEASNKWLKNGDLFPETEGFITSIQDHVLPTRNYKKYIIKDPQMVDDKCRMCRGKSETIEHITTSCPTMAAREYTDRHNAVAKILHGWLASKMGYVTQRKPYYIYVPENVCETPAHLLYWDRTIHTDHRVMNNRPDIVLFNKNTKKCIIIDVAIPAPVNILEKYKEKTAKYLPLAAELKQIWKAEEVQIIPIVLGATGEIPRKLMESLKSLDLPAGLYIEMQKAVILATANIVRKTFNMTEV